jgi:hypothetical protein
MDWQSSTRQRETGSGRLLSRRKIVKGSVVVAGAGVLTAATVRSADAAVQATTVESGAVGPAVVNLADADTIAVDASLGNDLRVTIAGNRTMGSPANASNGQQIIFQVTQGAGGPFTLTWASGYEFSSTMPQPALSTTAGQTDLLGFIYNAAMGSWLFAAFVNGFD